MNKFGFIVTTFCLFNASISLAKVNEGAPSRTWTTSGLEAATIGRVLVAQEGQAYTVNTKEGVSTVALGTYEGQPASCLFLYGAYWRGNAYRCVVGVDYLNFPL